MVSEYTPFLKKACGQKHPSFQGSDSILGQGMKLFFLYLRREQMIVGRVRTQRTSINVARQREKEEVKREVDVS